MNAQEFMQELKSQTITSNMEMIVNTQRIIDGVKSGGDGAIIDYTQQFDGVKLDRLKVDPDQLKASWESLAGDLQAALKLAKQRIENYETSIIYQDIMTEELSYVYRPLEKVGFYVPGGTALYPSSVLMSVVPALVAGVKQIYVTTPTFTPNNITFATLYLCGIENVYSVGGAQAIAALAYGTETIPKVDKIVGPGNAYVAMAKRLVYGEVGIDSIAGPSEILIYVDDSADVEAVVYDIFAQAEHDVNARTFLFCEDPVFVDQVEACLQDLIDSQVRAEIIKASLANHHYVVVDQRDNLLEALDFIAAEHVSIQHRDQDEIVDRINYAGAIFKGAYSPEAIGDYVAGPSHVLPTHQTARFSHGLNVNDFRTSHGIIALQPSTFAELGPAAEIIAAAEGLDCHRQSLAVRREAQ